MRVALVSPYALDVPGGVQSHVRSLAARLRGLGDDVLVAGPGEPSGSGEVGLGPAVGVPFNDSVAPLALRPGAWRATTRALRDFGPDVVHVHEPMVPWVGLAAALGASAPVVGTFHAWSQDERLYRLARPLGRRVLARLDATVAVSRPAAEHHASALGVEPGRFTVVPNGVDVERFATAAPHPDVPSGPTVLFVGRLEPRKGIEVLLDAFVELRGRRSDVRLLVVGEGPVRGRARDLLPARLADDVRWLGRVPDDELAAWYAACDVYVSPALGGESFGIVLLEAMAAGAAVVASDIPGYAAVLRGGELGSLVPPGASRPLADAVAQLLDDEALRARRVAAGRDAVAAYAWPEVAGRLREIYADVTDAPGH